MNADEYKWTAEVEEILEKLRINCVNLSEYHRKRYYHFIYKNTLFLVLDEMLWQVTNGLIERPQPHPDLGQE